jgi:CBS domain-containing protein
MHEGVVTCAGNVKLRDALRIMSDNTVRSLVVTDETCALCGIVSQTDLVDASLRHPETWASRAVSEIMTRDVLTVIADTPLSAAAKLLIEKHVHRIIVVDSRDTASAVGVLSMSDIVRDLMEDA